MLVDRALWMLLTWFLWFEFIEIIVLFSIGPVHCMELIQSNPSLEYNFYYNVLDIANT